MLLQPMALEVSVHVQMQHTSPSVYKITQGQNFNNAQILKYNIKKIPKTFSHNGAILY